MKTQDERGFHLCCCLDQSSALTPWGDAGLGLESGLAGFWYPPYWGWKSWLARKGVHRPLSKVMACAHAKPKSIPHGMSTQTTKYPAISHIRDLLKTRGGHPEDPCNDKLPTPFVFRFHPPLALRHRGGYPCPSCFKGKRVRAVCLNCI